MNTGRLIRGLAGLGLALSLLPAFAQGLRPTAADQLDALQRAIVDKALERATRVSALGWIDEHGQLHEDTRIQSNLDLRGVRVRAYLEEAGLLQAGLDLPARPVALAASGAVPASRPRSGAVAACADARTHVRRDVALEGRWDPRDGRLAHAFLPTLARTGLQTIATRLNASGAWAPSAAAQTRSGYDRLLYESDLPDSPALRLTLRIGAAETAPEEAAGWFSRAAALLRSSEDGIVRERPLLVSLELTDARSGRTLWQAVARLDYPAEPRALVHLPIAAGFLQRLDDQLRQWTDEMSRQWQCEPIAIEASAQAERVITVAAGARVGLRLGDRLMLVDATRVPANALEPGGIDRSAIIEVEALAMNTSRARIVAGQPPSAGRWIALPL